MPVAWLTIPSCRPVAEAAPRLAKWKQQGFAIALLRQGDPIDCDMSIPTDHGEIRLAEHIVDGTGDSVAE